LRVPIKRQHQVIQVGDIAEMLVMSNREDLGRISKTSDIYIPAHKVWVSDYPYVQREAFVEVSQRLRERELRLQERDRNTRRRVRRNDQEAERDKSETLSRRPQRRSPRNPSIDWD
jgi:hypothetical protein